MSPKHQPRVVESRISLADSLMNEQMPPSFGISSGVILAAAYVVMGKLGLMLAIQPGYASGSTPPVGLVVTASYLLAARHLRRSFWFPSRSIFQ